MTHPKNATAPTGQGRGGKCNNRQADSITPKAPYNWRDHLPSPMDYYPNHVESIRASDENGMALAICPLHEGGDRTLRLDTGSRKGRWCCSVCGSGDLITFAQRRHNLSFAQARKELLDFERRRITEARASGRIDTSSLREVLERPLSPSEQRHFARVLSEQRARDEGVWPPEGVR